MGTEQGGGGPPPDAGLQFDKVEHAAPVAAPSCAACRRPIDDEYFELGGHMICAACARSVASGGDSGALLRALAFGAGAALLGTIVWCGILMTRDAQLGLVAIAVGLFVGWAVRKGSGGRGGWQFQALAMALTYVSIAASWLPIMIKVAQADNLVFTGIDDYFAIFLAALVRPLADGTIIGWIIVAIALYEGWKMNRRVPVNGPFRLSARRGRRRRRRRAPRDHAGRPGQRGARLRQLRKPARGVVRRLPRVRAAGVRRRAEAPGGRGRARRAGRRAGSRRWSRGARCWSCCRRRPCSTSACWPRCRR